MNALIADNTANMQAGLKLAKEKSVVNLSCAAHVGNMLLEEFAESYSSVTSLFVKLEEFFRHTHFARASYLNQMKNVGAGGGGLPICGSPYPRDGVPWSPCWKAQSKIAFALSRPIFS